MNGPDLFSARVASVQEDRPFQTEGIANLKDTLRAGVKRVVVEAPTGAGKTRIAARLAEGAMSKGKRLSFVVPAISLVDQTVEEFYDNGIREVGVIQADHILQDWAKPIQVCSIQTIDRRGVYPESAAVLFDECHELHSAHKKWLKHPDWQRIPMIGLSATPWAKGLGNYFETKLTIATISDLIEQGYLSKFKVYATGHPDLKNVKDVAGDYHEGQLSEVMQDGGLCADIVRTYRERWGKGKTLCFAVDRAHALSLQERFNFAGIKCGYQDADTPMDVRRMIRKMFHDGTYQIVVSVDTLTRGVDWDVRCIILARPTRSEMKFVQIMGRGLRPAPRGAEPKEHLVVLDHSDTTARLGFVTDIYHENLDSRATPIKRASPKVERLPMECENCTALYPPNRERKCPGCGHIRKIQSGVFESDGELVEVKRDGSLYQAKKIPAKDWTMDERAQFLAELKTYAQWNGYKVGWAAVKYKDKFKDWPPREIENVPAARILSPTMAAWIKSRNIAWARSKRRAEHAATA